MPNEDKVHIQSDDNLTTLRRAAEALEGFMEEHGSNVEGLPTLQETVSKAITRLEFIEDRMNNPAFRNFWSGADDNDPEYGMTKAQKVNRDFSQWMLNNYQYSTDPGYRNSDEGVAWKRDQNTESGTAGGYTIPVPLQTEVVRILDEYGVGRQIMLRMPMRSKTENAATLAARPTVSWQTGVTGAPGENVAPTRTGVTFGQITMGVETVIANTIISIQLMQDNIVDMANLLVDIFGREIARFEDTNIFGAGTEPYNGMQVLGTPVGSQQNEYGQIMTTQKVIMGGGSASGSNAFAKLSYQDFIDVKLAVQPEIRNEGIYLMSSDIEHIAMGIVDLEGRPIWNLSMRDSQPNTIFGRPYVVSNVLPNIGDDGVDQFTLAYGVFDRYASFNDRMDLDVRFSEEAAFEAAGIVMRNMERIGWTFLISEAFGLLYTSTT